MLDVLGNDTNVEFRKDFTVLRPVNLNNDSALRVRLEDGCLSFPPLILCVPLFSVADDEADTQNIQSQSVLFFVLAVRFGSITSVGSATCFRLRLWTNHRRRCEGR